MRFVWTAGSLGGPRMASRHLDEMKHGGRSWEARARSEGIYQMTVEEMQADIDFLLLRADCAGSCSFTSDRWTGMSSNSLVALAYGGRQSCMPSDRSDYAACVRTFLRLPKHRKTQKVRDGLRKARAAYLKHYPEDANSLDRRRRRVEWEAREAERWKRRRKRRRRA